MSAPWTQPVSWNNNNTGFVDPVTGALYAAIAADAAGRPQLRSGPSGVLLKTTSNKSLNASSGNTIAWDGVFYDTAGAWSSGNPSRITIPAGVTMAKFTCGADMLSALAAGNFFINLLKNGVQYAQVWEIVVGAGNEVVFGKEMPWISVAPGDYFEYSLQNNTASVEFLVASTTNIATYFGAQF